MDELSDVIVGFLSSVCVPIVVALISSGKVASRVTRKMKLDNISDKLDKLDYKVDYNQARTFRARILRFNGEIKREIHHDEEEFNDILEAIDGYENFCKANPGYPNNKAVLAIENIKDIYKKAYNKNDF